MGTNKTENTGKRQTAANIAQQLDLDHYRKPLLESMKRTLLAMGAAATIPPNKLKDVDARREARVYLTRMRQGAMEITSNAEAISAEINARSDRLEALIEEYEPGTKKDTRHPLSVDTRKRSANTGLAASGSLDL